jgi:hypothetical protein
LFPSMKGTNGYLKSKHVHKGLGINFLRIKCELLIFITYFSTVVPLKKSCFLSYRPFVVIATFSTGLVVYSVSWLGQVSILLNIMFHAQMERFQLELIYYSIYFSTVVPFNSCVFLSCRPFVVITFSKGLMKLQHPQDLLKMLY